MADGPAAALDLIEAISDEPILKAYPLLFGVRGDLLEKLGRTAEARTAFETAASLTRNERERKVMLDRAAAAG